MAVLLTVFPLISQAQIQPQKVKISATYLDSDKNLVESEADISGEAPLDVSFRVISEGIDDHTPAYEWHFRKDGATQDMLVRYEESTQYTFTESGKFKVTLKTRLTDTGVELDSCSLTVTISESRLEMPNAFSPNDDQKNDIYGAKGVSNPNSTAHYKSIIEFHGYIFNRWGQKLFEWTDVSKGWDGTYNGHPVKEGVYYVLVKAKGADGREYNIKKDVNLLRSYSSEESTSTTE
jgi:gliding motility-associated-like protein